jgi:mannose-6-phosphate isomerase class I
MESTIHQMMNPILFQTTDWDTLPRKEVKGETGAAWYRTLRFEGFRVRLVEYSENYKADHWCSVGHVVYCVEGEMVSEQMDGRTFTVSKGMSYTVSDDTGFHRSYSKHGVKLIIIDGNFLKNKKEATLNPWRM